MDVNKDYKYSNINNSHSEYCNVLRACFLRGRLRSSISDVHCSLRFLTLPPCPMAMVLCTRIAWVLCRNVRTLGLSLLPPRARCWPKKDSNGSWLSLSERRNKPGFIDSRYRAISTNEKTEGKEKMISLHYIYIYL